MSFAAILTRLLPRPSGVMALAAVLGCAGALRAADPAPVAPPPASATKNLEFTLQVLPLAPGKAVTAAEVGKAAVILKKRLERAKIRHADVAAKGDDGISVKIAGVNETALPTVRKVIESTATLELHEVCPRNDETGTDGKTLAERVKGGTEIVPGYKIYDYTRKDADGKSISTPILVNRRVAINGGDIAVVIPSPQQQDAVSITLNGAGTDKMIALTTDMRPGQDRIAIILSGEVISAPVVRSVPLGKNFIIEGLIEPGEVQSLAAALMCPLENPIKVLEFRTVSPSLDAK